jgi:hypothetical protein
MEGEASVQTGSLEVDRLASIGLRPLPLNAGSDAVVERGLPGLAWAAMMESDGEKMPDRLHGG